MQYCDFEYLKDFILDKNAYLQSGYAHAFKDDVSKRILAKQGSDFISLLPDDTRGNYFYLRNETLIRHEAQADERLTDYGTQRLSFLDSINVHLIAIVNDADAYRLIENLRNTVMLYDKLDILPQSSNWNREQIITEELAGMNKEDIAAALQRLKSETIVKLVWKASKQYIPSNCITNPCKNL